MVHDFHQNLVLAFLEFNADLVGTVRGLRGRGAFQNHLAVHPNLEEIIGTQAQFSFAVFFNFDCPIEIVGAVDAVKLMHEQVPLAVFEVPPDVPFHFFAHTGIRLFQINFLLRLIGFGESRLKSFRLEWADAHARVLFWAESANLPIGRLARR